MSAISKIAGVLVIIGALNWGLVGAFDFNLVTTILGESALTTIVYILVGLSGVVGVIDMVKGKSSM